MYTIMFLLIQNRLIESIFCAYCSFIALIDIVQVQVRKNFRPSLMTFVLLFANNLNMTQNVSPRLSTKIHFASVLFAVMFI